MTLAESAAVAAVASVSAACIDCGNPTRRGPQALTCLECKDVRLRASGKRYRDSHVAQRTAAQAARRARRRAE